MGYTKLVYVSAKLNAIIKDPKWLMVVQQLSYIPHHGCIADAFDDRVSSAEVIKSINVSNTPPNVF